MKSHCMLAYMFALTLLVVSGCVSAGVATQNPTPFHDRVQKCVASSHDRNACMQFANQRCAGGFEVFEMDAAEGDGVVRRAYYFKCLL